MKNGISQENYRLHQLKSKQYFFIHNKPINNFYEQNFSEINCLIISKQYIYDFNKFKKYLG